MHCAPWIFSLQLSKNQRQKGKLGLASRDQGCVARPARKRRRSGGPRATAESRTGLRRSLWESLTRGPLNRNVTLDSECPAPERPHRRGDNVNR